MNTFDQASWKCEGRSAKNCSLSSQKRIKSCEKSPLPRWNKNTTEFGVLWVLNTYTRLTAPNAARLSSGRLADFLARKDLADFLLEAFTRFSRRRFRVFGE